MTEVDLNNLRQRRDLAHAFALVACETWKKNQKRMDAYKLKDRYDEIANLAKKLSAEYAKCLISAALQRETGKIQGITAQNDQKSLTDA